MLEAQSIEKVQIDTWDELYFTKETLASYMANSLFRIEEVATSHDPSTERERGVILFVRSEMDQRLLGTIRVTTVLTNQGVAAKVTQVTKRVGKTEYHEKTKGT